MPLLCLGNRSLFGWRIVTGYGYPHNGRKVIKGCSSASDAQVTGAHACDGSKRVGRYDVESAMLESQGGCSSNWTIVRLTWITAWSGVFFVFISRTLSLPISISSLSHLRDTVYFQIPSQPSLHRYIGTIQYVNWHSLQVSCAATSA